MDGGGGGYEVIDSWVIRIRGMGFRRMNDADEYLYFLGFVKGFIFIVLELVLRS